MRLFSAHFLALCLPLFGSTSHALPPQAQSFGGQQPLHPLPERSTWRKVSDGIIGSIFSPPEQSTPPSTVDTSRSHRMAPAHVMSKYGGDIVLRFNVSTSEEVQMLAEAAETLLLDVWEYSSNWVDIRLPMEIVAPLLGLLPQSLQHSHVPLLRERDLANAVFNTYPSSYDPKDSFKYQPSNPVHHHSLASTAQVNRDGPENNIFFADYQPLSVLEPWMRLMASLFSSHVRLIKIGISGQGRDISALRVGVHPTNAQVVNPPKRRTVLIVGGTHAREWITTSTVTFLAYNLITGYGKDEHITRLLKEFDFVFVPTINPDGYVYTWDTDRLWRKNRQSTTIRFCPGIDIDRSFDFGWDGMTNTMNSPCSESFAGDQPFAAVEARQFSKWARNETKHNNVDFVGFLDLHAYSQQILYPYSYSCDSQPPGLENLEELAYGLQKAIRMSHGHIYEVLPACQGNSVLAKSSTDAPSKIGPRMESSGGSALDWFYGTLKVRYAYQLKLRDRGSYGFLLPKEHIVPTGQETLDALMSLADFLSTKLSSSAEK